MVFKVFKGVDCGPMDFYEFYLNRWVYPVLLTCAFFLLVYYKPFILAWLEPRKTMKKSPENKFFAGLKEGVKTVYLASSTVKLGDWKKTVLLPVALAVALDLLVSFVFQMPMRSYGEPAWFAGITSGFLNPVSEEFVFRGMLFGGVLLGLTGVLMPKTSKKKAKNSKLVEYGALLAAAIVVSIVFTAYHENYTLYQLTSRFASSMLYCVLYLASGKNLLPAITAHAASNWLLIASDFAAGAISF